MLALVKVHPQLAKALSKVPEAGMDKKAKLHI